MGKIITQSKTAYFDINGNPCNKKDVQIAQRVITGEEVTVKSPHNGRNAYGLVLMYKQESLYNTIFLKKSGSMDPKKTQRARNLLIELQGNQDLKPENITFAMSEFGRFIA